MRLSRQERLALKEALQGVPFPAHLIGSRTDDAKRGGDVDIIILSRGLDEAARLRLSLRITARFQSLCDEKVDVSVIDAERQTPSERAFLSLVDPVKLPLAA